MIGRQRFREDEAALGVGWSLVDKGRSMSKYAEGDVKEGARWRNGRCLNIMWT